MKKILCIILVVTMCLGLAACGTAEPASVTESKKDKVVQQTPETSDTQQTTDEPDTQQTPETPDIQQTPSTPGVQQTPSTPGVQQTPSTPAIQQTPSTPEVKEPTLEFWNPDNCNGAANTITVNPRWVYWENGKLVAECFVINGYDYPVNTVNVNSITFSNGAGVIATSGFGVMQNETGIITIGAKSYTVWTFIFSADTVFIQNADLSSLTCNASTGFYY